MLHSRVHIAAADLVIVFMTRDNMTAITITPGEQFHNKYGRYTHDDMIGMKFGSKMHSPKPHNGYIHLLRPTPELWTLSLPHRTQILYMPDIAYITMRLGVRVGGTAMEAGTGSGSFTHALARAVGVKGKIRSFEYHQMRYEAARLEFEGHGLGMVQLEHRNVCKDGFGDAHGVEAVFLDLPAPWEAIPHAKKTLRPDIITKICCFSPCLEQVLKTVTTLRSEGFEDISTQEVLSRTHELAVNPPSGSSSLSTVSDIVNKLRSNEQKKEERRVIQMRTAREKVRKQREAKENAESARIAAGGVAEQAEEGDKHPKRKFEEIDLDITPISTNLSSRPAWEEHQGYAPTLVLTKPSPEMRGHTSYLTFASYYPLDIRQQLEQTKPIISRLATLREGSVEASDYGSEGLDEVMGTMTEEDLIGLGV